MDAYAKQGQEILRKKLQNDYESVDEVNKKIVENLVIAKKKQSKNLDEDMAKKGAAATSDRKKDGTYFFFLHNNIYYLDRNLYFNMYLRLLSWCCFRSLHRKKITLRVIRGSIAPTALYFSKARYLQVLHLLCLLVTAPLCSELVCLR